MAVWWKRDTRGTPRNLLRNYSTADPVARQFNHVNSLSLIARAHQLVQEGYKYMFDESLVTVWSAPNYCYRCGNLASILTVKENGEREFKVYEAAEENERDKNAGKGRKFVSVRLHIMSLSCS